RIEAAVHVAIERGVANRDLGLVAGGDDNRPELVRDRHEEGATRSALQVLLGRVGTRAGEDLGEILGQPINGIVDREGVVAHAKGFCSWGPIIYGLFSG